MSRHKLVANEISKALFNVRSYPMPKKKSGKVTKKRQTADNIKIPVNKIEYLVKEHAPENWKTELSLDKLYSLLESGKEIEMIVLACDIRRSTFLMKEAVNFKGFAETIGQFVGEASVLLRGSRGWFDKFTGDGFLAYWIIDERDMGSYISELFNTCHKIIDGFRKNGVKFFRKNSKNFPEGIGVSLGIDGGPASIVTIAGALTIVGSPVVGAVRMVSAVHKPYETLANVYIGEALYEKREELLENNVEITKEFRPTKEYPSPSGQEVYPIRFLLLE